MFQFTLRAARISCGYTVEEVANKCGVSAKTISKCEENAAKIGILLIFKIARLYGVSTDDIYCGPESECIKHNRARMSSKAAQSKKEPAYV